MSRLNKGIHVLRVTAVVTGNNLLLHITNLVYQCLVYSNYKKQSMLFCLQYYL